MWMAFHLISNTVIGILGKRLLKLRNGYVFSGRTYKPRGLAFADTPFNLNSSAMSSYVTGKPPNIAIYTGTRECGSEGQFAKWKEILTKYLVLDRYVLFHLDDQQVLHDPWQRNVELLVIACEISREDISRNFKKYFDSDGKVLCVPLCLTVAQKLNNGINHCKSFKVTLLDQVLDIVHRQIGSTKCRIQLSSVDVIDEASFDGDIIVKTTDANGVVAGELKAEAGIGKMVFSQVNFYENSSEDNSWSHQVLIEMLQDRLSLDCQPTDCNQSVVVLPSMTPCCVSAENRDSLNRFRQKLDKRINIDERGRTVVRGPELTFLLNPIDMNDDSHATSTNGPKEISLLFSGNKESSFSYDCYFANLKTKDLGKVLIYSDVISSTMDIINSVQIPELVVAVAGKQINGKGRGKHVWLSPKGCAMFSLRLAIPLGSMLGHHMTFMQHLAALAMVEGVKAIPGCQDLDVKLKWPNDVYYKNLAKIGGLLVESTIDSHYFYCTIGCGLNVNNGHPTVCLNDMIKGKCVNSEQRPLLSIEQVIAQIISKLEELVSEFQRNGLHSILPLYYSNWLHSDAEVRVAIGEGNTKVARIMGLDDYGFLRVQFVDDPKVTLSVQPDGNSFDMLHNLLIVRNSSH